MEYGGYSGVPGETNGALLAKSIGFYFILGIKRL